MKAEIKERIEQLRCGKVPEGYSNKIGVYMPLSWNQQLLGKLASPIKEKAGDGKYDVLSITAGKGFVLQADKFGKNISGKQYEQYTVLKKGDFSYNKGNSKTYPQGCVYMLEDWEKAVVPNVFDSFRPKHDDFVSEYYKHLFISGYLNHQLFRIINSGVRNDGLLNLYDKDFYNCVVPVPPICEQKKIAEILTNCDEVIDRKKQLIEENGRRKKWLMQKLLNPDSGIRLPEFEGSEWEKVTIGAITQVCAGATPSTSNAEYWNGNIRWMSSGELNLKQVYEVEGRITEAGLNNSGTKMLPLNCVLIGLAGQGKTRGTVAINRVELCTNQSVAAIFPSKHFVPEYLYHNLENRYWELRKLSSGDGARGGLNLDLISGVVVKLPSIKEQTAIAEVLSVADREIYLLEQELIQWQLKKKSLMQFLLTGIVRV